MRIRLEENDLIHLSQNGDIASFNQLVINYQKLIYNLAFRMVSDREIAADITQDTFISAFKAIKSFRGGSFKAWILRIASNLSQDHYRYKKRRPTESLDLIIEDIGEQKEFADNSISPEDSALRSERINFIHKCLQKLSPEQRLTLILCDIDGLSYEEIAEITKSSIGTVKSRLNRARQNMRLFFNQNMELFIQYRRPEK